MMPWIESHGGKTGILHFIGAGLHQERADYYAEYSLPLQLSNIGFADLFVVH
jgi:hypothetical protein